MKSESERYLGLLERRLLALDSLSSALAGSRADFISMDIEAIQQRIQEQEQFCSQIRALDNDITTAQVRCAKLSGMRPPVNEISWPDSGATDAALGDKIYEAMQRIAVAQVNLKRLNDAHQALLRRSRRTVHVLVNLFQSYAPTYAVQASPATGTICEERV
jgi:hypothetical protein